MRFSDAAAPVLTTERGGVLVMVAVWLPVLLIFLMFVVEVGNWFEHKRHLQLQADAGAFAGGGLFNACFVDAAGGSAAIESEARRYAGDPLWAGGLGSSVYNSQIGGSNRGLVNVRINRKTYEKGGPGPDDTIEAGPCAAKMVDVKMTEADLPWFFKLNVVPAINARARVEIQQKESTAGALPVGVPDNNPLSAAAIFVDEANGSILRVESLAKVGTATLNGVSLTQWTGDPTPVNVATRTGVVIALSGLESWAPSGTLTQICGQLLVECYDGGGAGPWTGLNFVHGYAPTGGNPSATNPVVRDVILYNQTCMDGSGPYFLLHAGCTVGVKARIDFGPNAGSNPSLPPAKGGVSAEVKVDRAGTNCPQAGQDPKGCNMVYNASGANAGYWTTNGTNGYPLIAADGVAHPIALNWGTGSGNTKVTGTFTNVQRSYSAGSGSEPVEYISVSEVGPGANSLTLGSHNLSVTIGVKPSLQANSNDPNAPAVALKVTGSGSRGQAIDCDPGNGTNLAYELGHGCTPTYTLNKGTPCQADQYYVFPQTAPWDCTRVQTGGSVGQVHDGMLDRTQGGVNSCINPINWKDVNGDGKVSVPEDIPESDPRLVPVFVTPFASFNGQGNDVIPIINFATFYVTGFSRQGGGQGDPCPGASPVPNKQGGYIVGHFIKYVETINTGGGGSACDFDAFGTCVAVLTQ